MVIRGAGAGTTGASAPKPNYPAVYAVTLNQPKHLAFFHALFFDESRATAADGRHRGQLVKLGLTDPDSNEVVPGFAPRFGGNFMLTSQGDKEQIYVNAPRAKNQRLRVLALSQSVHDTDLSPSWPGPVRRVGAGWGRWCAARGAPPGARRRAGAPGGAGAPRSPARPAARGRGGRGGGGGGGGRAAACRPATRRRRPAFRAAARRSR